MKRKSSLGTINEEDYNQNFKEPRNFIVQKLKEFEDNDAS